MPSGNKKDMSMVLNETLVKMHQINSVQDDLKQGVKNTLNTQQEIVSLLENNPGMDNELNEKISILYKSNASTNEKIHQIEQLINDFGKNFNIIQDFVEKKLADPFLIQKTKEAFKSMKDFFGKLKESVTKFTTSVKEFISAFKDGLKIGKDSVAKSLNLGLKGKDFTESLKEAYRNCEGIYTDINKGIENTKEQSTEVKSGLQKIAGRMGVALVHGAVGVGMGAAAAAASPAIGAYMVHKGVQKHGGYKEVLANTGKTIKDKAVETFKDVTDSAKSDVLGTYHGFKAAIDDNKAQKTLNRMSRTLDEELKESRRQKYEMYKKSAEKHQSARDELKNKPSRDELKNKPSRDELKDKPSHVDKLMQQRQRQQGNSGISM